MIVSTLIFPAEMTYRLEIVIHIEPFSEELDMSQCCEVLIKESKQEFILVSLFVS